MYRTLEYTLRRTHCGTPLVTLDAPLRNGQEIKSDVLKALAHASLDVATGGTAGTMQQTLSDAQGRRSILKIEEIENACFDFFGSGLPSRRSYPRAR